MDVWFILSSFLYFEKEDSAECASFSPSQSNGFAACYQKKHRPTPKILPHYICQCTCLLFRSRDCLLSTGEKHTQKSKDKKKYPRQPSLPTDRGIPISHRIDNGQVPRASNCSLFYRQVILHTFHFAAPVMLTRPASLSSKKSYAST